MLTHLSARFRQDVIDQGREPRAALFLNRFTRTLTIMYATSGIEKIIGIPSEDMKGRSFYFCIAEASLEEAVRVLESAKGNDSIAYLRFQFRDPRQDDEPTENDTESDLITDTEMTDVEEGATDAEDDRQNDPPPASRSESTGFTTSGTGSGNISRSQSGSAVVPDPIELEAVVSCTSDGLVVCLRRARPLVPPQMLDTRPTYTSYFAAPWGIQPIYSPAPPMGYVGTSMWPGMPSVYGGPPPPPQPVLQQPTQGAVDDMAFLAAIRECGVFAWDLVGINGELADYARGEPAGVAAPVDGPAVWDPKLEDASTSSGRGTTASS
jgi:hypothetical protein